MPNSTPLLRDIRLGTDLEELTKLRPDRTMCSWDPQWWPNSDDAFWLCGRSDSDQIAFTIAARRFILNDFHTDIVSGCIFYPKAGERACETITIAPSDDFPLNVFSRLKDNVAHTGNLWVAPAFRGQGLPAIATRALHREILSRWDVDWIFGLQEKELAYKGLWQDQGYPHCEGQVIWDHNVYGQRFDMKVVYGSRDEISRTL